MVRLLAKVVLRCKDEHSRLSVESDFLVYCDTGKHGVTSTLFQMAKAWKAKKLGGRQSHDLLESDALPRHPSIPSGQAPEPDYERGPAESGGEARVLGDWGPAFESSWVLPHLERGGAEERQVQQGCTGARADPEYSVRAAQVYSRRHKVLTRSHAARPGRKVGGAGVALSRECEGARQSSVRCFVRASRQHGPERS